MVALYILLVAVFYLTISYGLSKWMRQDYRLFLRSWGAADGAGCAIDVASMVGAFALATLIVNPYT